MRQLYEQMMGTLDANRNGMADMLEGGGSPVNAQVTGSINVVHDGKVYTRVEDMPLDVRQKYEKAMSMMGDANQNGMPDMLEGIKAVNVQISGLLNVMHEGKVFTRMEDMPPDVRQKYEKAMSLMGDANQNGVPDILESAGLINAQPAPSASDAFASTPLISTTNAPVTSGETPNYTRWLAIGAVVVILLGLLAGAAVVGLFAFRSFLR